MIDLQLDLNHDQNREIYRDIHRDTNQVTNPESSRSTSREPSRERYRELPVLQRKNSSVLNSLSSRKLSHHPSKLDLIDDTTLTSLPLPPPPPRARLRRGDLTSSKLSKKSVSTITDVAPVASLFGNSTDLGCASPSAWPADDSVVEFTDNYGSTLGPDDTSEDLQDPIVLVEDYVRGGGEDAVKINTLTRKKSLATFKQRFIGGRFVSILPESLFRARSKRSVSTDDTTFCRADTEDLEAIFGKIPGSDKLKYCDLCDKPLYEISSIISSAEDRVTPHNVSHGADDPEVTKTDISHLYNEFICWDCINIYEVFLNELYEAEVDEERKMQIQTKKDTSTTEKLLEMFNSIRETYHTEISEPPKKQTKRAFSTDLLNRLHYLSTMSEPPKNGTEWLNNLRQRLRWRWRLENLLPKPFVFERQRNS